MKRLAAVILAALFSVAVAAPAQAVDTDEFAKRCTNDFTYTYPHPRICIRISYVDRGNAVTLEKMTGFVENPRTGFGGLENGGFKLSDIFVKCNRNDGSVDWFIFPVADRVMDDDRDVYTWNPTNMDCGERNVVFGGVGILRIVWAPDYEALIGNQALNYLQAD